MIINDTRSGDMSFSEYTTLLYSQVYDGIVSSMLEQEKKIAELEEAVGLTSAEFAARYISEDTLRLEILRLFPPTTLDLTKSAIDPGMVYTVANPPTVGENPAIYRLTGYCMTINDYTPGTTGMVITEIGYNAIKTAIRVLLAVSQQQYLHSMLLRGIPRLLADTVKIRSKIFMNYTPPTSLSLAQTSSQALLPLLRAVDTKPSAESPNSEADPKTLQASMIIQPNTTSTSLNRSLTTASSSSRLTVRPVNSLSSEILSLSTDIISEIEITFKTVNT